MMSTQREWSCGWRGGEGSVSCGHPHKKLVPTDIILSSSHAKKLLALFVPVSELCSPLWDLSSSFYRILMTSFRLAWAGSTSE